MIERDTDSTAKKNEQIKKIFDASEIFVLNLTTANKTRSKPSFYLSLFLVSFSPKKTQEQIRTKRTKRKISATEISFQDKVRISRNDKGYKRPALMNLNM